MADLLPENEFRYFLTYKNVRTQFYAAPEDWDKDTIGKFARDIETAGIMRTLSLPISFVLDGYNIVKQAFINDGYEAEVFFECEQLEHATFIYRPRFSSDLDFSQYKDTGIRANVMLLESGVSATLRAKEDTKYEYPLTGLDVVNIRIPGVVFNEKADFIFTNEGESDRFMNAIDLVNNDTNSGFVDVQNVEQQENITDESIFTTSENWFVKGNRPTGVPIKIKGNIKVDAYRPPLGDHGNDFAVLLKDNSGATIQTIFQSPSLNINQHYIYDIPFDIDINLALDQKLFFYIRTDVIPSDLKVTVTDGDLNISYTQVSDPSNCKGVRIEDLFKRIARRIVPQQAVDSYLLRNQWNGLIITCGNAIRELADAAIQTTLADFFKTCNALESAGMGFDTGILRLEQRPFFFRPYKIETLTGVKSCEFSVWNEALFNAVSVGYNDGNTDDTDGQYEYNSKQEWDLPIVRVQRKEDWVSPYRADQYGIEKLRVDFIKKTNDTSSDNDVFMFDCEFDGTNWNPIKGSSTSYISVSGMSSAAANLAAYNLRLTPKENLLRHDSYLSSMLFWYNSRYIEFASAEKNKDLEFVRSGQGIASNFQLKQSQSIPVASLNGLYFQPVVATLQCKLPLLFMSKMDANSFGYLEWEWQGDIYQGYILELDVDLARNTEREVKLLLTDKPSTVALPPVAAPLPPPP